MNTWMEIWCVPYSVMQSEWEKPFKGPWVMYVRYGDVKGHFLFRPDRMVDEELRKTFLSMAEQSCRRWKTQKVAAR